MSEIALKFVLTEAAAVEVQYFFGMYSSIAAVNLKDNSSIEEVIFGEVVKFLELGLVMCFLYSRA